MHVAAHLAPCEDDPAVLRNNFDSVVCEIPRTNLANQNVALSIGSAHKISPRDGLDFDADRPSYNAVISSKALDFPGHEVAISDTVFCLPVLALLPNRHRTA